MNVLVMKCSYNQQCLHGDICNDDEDNADEDLDLGLRAKSIRSRAAKAQIRS